MSKIFNRLLGKKEVPTDELHVYYASFTSRLYAAAIDFFLLLPIVYFLKEVVVHIDHEKLQQLGFEFQKQQITASEFLVAYKQEYIASGALTFDIVIQLVTLLLITYLWHRFAATPGKKLLGMKVVDADTLENPSKSQACVRSIAYIVSMLPVFAGFFAIAFDRRKQGFHDKIANTLVLYTVPHDAAWHAKRLKRNSIIGFTIIGLCIIFLLVRKWMY